jgi:hypothetical protein
MVSGVPLNSKPKEHTRDINYRDAPFEIRNKEKAIVGTAAHDSNAPSYTCRLAWKVTYIVRRKIGNL